MSVGTAEREGEEGERFTEALRLFRRQAIKILLLSLHQAWWEVWIVDMKQTSSVSQSQTTCSCHILLCSSAKTNNFIISTHKQNKLIKRTIWLIKYLYKMLTPKNWFCIIIACSKNLVCMSEIEIIDVVNFNNNVTQNTIFEIYCVFVRTKTTWYKQIKKIKYLAAD